MTGLVNFLIIFLTVPNIPETNLKSLRNSTKMCQIHLVLLSNFVSAWLQSTNSIVLVLREKLWCMFNILFFLIIMLFFYSESPYFTSRPKRTVITEIEKNIEFQCQVKGKPRLFLIYLLVMLIYVNNINANVHSWCQTRGVKLQKTPDRY